MMVRLMRGRRRSCQRCSPWSLPARVGSPDAWRSANGARPSGSGCGTTSSVDMRHTSSVPEVRRQTAFSYDSTINCTTQGGRVAHGVHWPARGECEIDVLARLIAVRIRTPEPGSYIEVARP